MLRPMVWATTQAIAPASILLSVFSAAALRLAFCNMVREVMNEHQELLQRGLTGQEYNLAVVADAKEPCSFFACKITC